MSGGSRLRVPGAALALAAFLLLSACGEQTPDPAAAGNGDAAAPAPPAPSRELTGAELWLACAGCHSIEPGAPHRVGPNLHGIIGRAAATRPGYAYSGALSGSGIVWGPGLLRGFIMNAESMVPGTWMAYRDVMNAAELDRLVDYVVARASAAAADGPGDDQGDQGGQGAEAPSAPAGD